MPRMFIVEQNFHSNKMMSILVKLTMCLTHEVKQMTMEKLLMDKQERQMKVFIQFSRVERQTNFTFRLANHKNCKHESCAPRKLSVCLRDPTAECMYAFHANLDRSYVDSDWRVVSCLNLLKSKMFRLEIYKENVWLESRNSTLSCSHKLNGSSWNCLKFLSHLRDTRLTALTFYWFY